MELRLQIHIECIYFFKWIAVGFINRLYCCFLTEVEHRTEDNNQAMKRSKIIFNKVLRVSATKFSGIILDFIKKVVWIFGFSEAPEQTIDYMYCKLSSLFLLVSVYSQQEL